MKISWQGDRCDCRRLVPLLMMAAIMRGGHADAGQTERAALGRRRTGAHGRPRSSVMKAVDRSPRMSSIKKSARVEQNSVVCLPIGCGPKEPVTRRGGVGGRRPQVRRAKLYRVAEPARVDASLSRTAGLAASTMRRV